MQLKQYKNYIILWTFKTSNHDGIIDSYLSYPRVYVHIIDNLIKLTVYIEINIPNVSDKPETIYFGQKKTEYLIKIKNKETTFSCFI